MAFVEALSGGLESTIICVLTSLLVLFLVWCFYLMFGIVRIDPIVIIKLFAFIDSLRWGILSDLCLLYWVLTFGI